MYNKYNRVDGPRNIFRWTLYNRNIGSISDREASVNAIHVNNPDEVSDEDEIDQMKEIQRRNLNS